MAYKIVLGAGHGGEDPGAVYIDRKEKDDNLSLALAVGKILEDNGIDVVYTRTTDIYQTPFEKARFANETGADFFISTANESIFLSESFLLSLMPKSKKCLAFSSSTNTPAITSDQKKSPFPDSSVPICGI